MAIAESAEVLVTLGIDTHHDHHVAVALDQFGRRLGVLMFQPHRLAMDSWRPGRMASARSPR